MNKLHEQKGITITHTEIEGADHFFKDAHMKPMINTVSDYVKRRLGESLAVSTGSAERGASPPRWSSWAEAAHRLKSVLRGTTLHDGSRRENSAEHSWHIMLYALTLAEHAERPVNIDRVLKMLLIHDLAEIDAGDAPIHGSHDAEAQAKVEQAAADRLLRPPAARSGRRLPRALGRVRGGRVRRRRLREIRRPRAARGLEPRIPAARPGSPTPSRPTKLQARVGAKVRRGAPALGSHLSPRISAWFVAR